MESKEYEFKGLTLNGIMMLIMNIILQLGSIVLAVFYGIEEMYCLMTIFIILAVAALFVWGGFVRLEPNEARVMMFFGKYRGTFTQTGYYWVNPCQESVTARKEP